MKLSRGLVVAGAFLGCTFQGYHAEARGPSTPEERAKVVELTRARSSRIPLVRTPPRLDSGCANGRSRYRKSDFTCATSCLATVSAKTILTPAK